jgi:DNA-binding PadR family transcriptional regulator
MVAIDGVRMTPATVAVLEALAGDAGQWHYGYDLLGTTGLRSGSLYPILVRLADRGLLEAVWENGVPQGRPPRHLYRLTPAGRALVREARAAAAARPQLRLRHA